MTIHKIESNQWLISQGNVPAYFLHRLRRGKVGIYESGERIATVEVREGMKPRLLGVLSALRSDHKHTASVKTESESEIESIYLSEILEPLQADLTDEMRAKLDQMIDAIETGDQIKALRQRLSHTEVVELEIPAHYNAELTSALQELQDIYQSIMNDPITRDSSDTRS